MKKVLGMFLLTLMGSVSGIVLYKQFFEEKRAVFSTPLPAKFAKYQNDASGLTFPNFIQAVEVARPAVVHVRSKYQGNAAKGKNPWGGLFGDDFKLPSPGGESSGSGVIISPDGYIATNNHVIENADEISIIMTDNRRFKAKVVGVDKSTDLALLKIEAENLPHIQTGSSDDIQIGEWVVAIGNPMELTSTVTAGIVSAKGRDIRLLDGNYRIESFIQTDAAVNPGNSGGALVDVNGQLVGINTAIASRTGMFAGYSFAIPAAIVKKVMEDLLQFGEVRRGILGISIDNVDAEKAEDFDLSTLQGALVKDVRAGSGAADAGMKKGDVIIAVNEHPVSNSSELQEQIGRFRPGDAVKVKILRGKDEKTLSVKLKKLEETEDVILGQVEDENEDGDSEENLDNQSRGSVAIENAFRTLTPEEKNKLGVDKGIMVMSENSKLLKGGVKPGFVITKVNGKPVTSISMLTLELKNTKGMVSLEGLYEKGMIASYSFTW